MTSIYLDYNASTPIDPAVAAAMQPFLDEAFGNPSSGHWASTSAKAALENARSQVAGLLGCDPTRSCSQAAQRGQQPGDSRARSTPSGTRASTSSPSRPSTSRKLDTLVP